MPRYFFDLRDGRYLTLDEEGEDLPDVEAARREALRIVGDAIKDLGREESSALQVAVAVRNCRGPVLSVGATVETASPVE